MLERKEQGAGRGGRGEGLGGERIREGGTGGGWGRGEDATMGGEGRPTSSKNSTQTNERSGEGGMVVGAGCNAPPLGVHLRHANATGGSCCKRPDVTQNTEISCRRFRNSLVQLRGRVLDAQIEHILKDREMDNQIDVGRALKRYGWMDKTDRFWTRKPNIY